MKIWIFSDTHGNHESLTVPHDIDLAIFCGDCSNYRDPAKNLPEVTKFYDWYNALHIPKKIAIAGNHDTSIEKRLILPYIQYPDIIYLEHEEVAINGYRIFGSPWTPVFNNWAFNKKPNRLEFLWNQIPEDIDILITHGPPKYIADLSYNHENQLERCGDKSLLNRVLNINPRVHAFGHIHSGKRIYNAGIYKGLFNNNNTTFINAACFDLKQNIVNNGFQIYL